MKNLEKKPENLGSKEGSEGISGWRGWEKYEKKSKTGKYRRQSKTSEVPGAVLSAHNLKVTPGLGSRDQPDE